MQRQAFPALASAFVALAACSTVPQPATETLASTELKLADGQPAGTARVVSDGQGVRLIADVTGVSPGLHGIHLHTVGQCEAPAFTSAGGHLNPEGKQHGTENPAGSHLGDLPNITADESGKGSISVALHSTREQLLNVLFDSDGTAVVVHAGPDDYKTDPAGNSGGRIACGVLARP